MRRYAAIVIGLGVMGSAAAAAIARRGASVLGIEQFAALHDRGSSHGASRIVRMAYFEHHDYVPLLRRAYAGWSALEDFWGHPLIAWNGVLMIGQTDSAVVAGTLDSAERWELPHEVLDRGTMRARYPQFALHADEVAVFEGSAGVIHADAALRAQLAEATAQGAELRFETPVAGWDLTADGVVVDIAGEQVAAPRLVIAAGPWAARVLAGTVPLQPVRTATYHYAPADPGAFAAGRFPAFVWERDAGDALYGMAEAQTATCKLGFHHRHTPVDPDRVAPAVSTAEIAAMGEQLAERIPDLAGPCVASATCLYTMTPDGHFVVGEAPGSGGRVAIAAGFSGHGFKFAPVVGEVLADLALDGGTSAPIGLFGPTRFDPT